MLVGSDRIRRLLSPEADILSIQPDNLSELATAEFDLLLLVPSLGMTVGWSRIFEHDGALLLKMKRVCEQRGKPFVVWHMDHATNAPLYACAALAADLVCAASPSSFEAYVRLGVRPACLLLLPWAVQPTEAHPYRQFSDTIPGSRAGILFDGWFDLHRSSELEASLAPMLFAPTTIVESMYRMTERQLAIGKEYAGSVAGCVSESQLNDLLRSHLASVFTLQSSRSPETIQACIMCAAACGCLPILCGNSSAELTLPEGALHCKTRSQLQDVAETITGDTRARIEFHRSAHQAWRSVMVDHTFANRLSTLCTAVGVAFPWDPLPFVSVVVPTYRTELLPDCISQYRNQRYPNKELIVVLHTNDDIRNIKASVESEHADVRIYRQPTDVGVGACLNLAFDAARGAYSVKMDDDDFYSENYLLDMMLPLRAVDVDLFGKPPHFIYLESTDRVYLRTVDAATPHLITTAQALAKGKVRISGATHSGRTEVFRRVRFPTMNIGSADTAFYLRCQDRDLTVGIWDGFGTIAVRHTDKQLHTWKVQDDTIRQNSREVGRGFDVRVAAA